MRIGFDIDGVLADFNKTFIEFFVAATGRDLFPKRPFAIPTWDYPQHYGYTEEENKMVWGRITSDPKFWYGLEAYEDVTDNGVLKRIRELAVHNDVYFVTSRPGVMAKQQTELWLQVHAEDFVWNPTVLIASNKGQAATLLKLDAYIDDRWENCVSVIEATRPDQKNLLSHCNAPTTRTFLYLQPWNIDRYHHDADQWQKYFIAPVSDVHVMIDRVMEADAKAV